MNKTGLADSFSPSITSPLFSSVPNDDEWFRTLISGFPSSLDFFKQSSLPFVFDFNALKCPTERLKTSGNLILPRCSNCSAFPTQYSTHTQGDWTCCICGQKNSLEADYFIPSTDCFDLVLPNSSTQPLFLFIFQPTAFFTNPQLLQQIGKALDHWSHENDYQVALISLGQISISFDLKDPHSYCYVDEAPQVLPCNGYDSHFEICLGTLLPSPSLIFPSLLQSVFLNLCHHKINTENSQSSVQDGSDQTENPKSSHNEEKCFICATIFSNEMTASSDFHFQDFEGEISIQLFTTPNFGCESFAKNCQRINVIGESTPNVLAPRLFKTLASGSLFDTRIRLFSPPSFHPEFAIYNGIFETPICASPYLDGQSSASFHMRLRYAPRSPIVFIQICLSGLLGSGKRLLRIATVKLKSMGMIEKIDGAVYGVFLARKVAAELQTHPQEEAFISHREKSISLITEWSKKGDYRRSIPTLYRDIPLFMFSIEQYTFFSPTSTKIEKIASQKDCLRMCCSILQRELYPVLFIPPFLFPHRLNKKTIIGAKLTVFLGGVEGIAVAAQEGYEEEIDNISKKFHLPITMLVSDNYDIANNFLVEEQGTTFPVYASRMEAEVNARRF